MNAERERKWKEKWEKGVKTVFIIKHFFVFFLGEIIKIEFSSFIESCVFNAFYTVLCIRVILFFSNVLLLYHQPLFLSFFFFFCIPHPLQNSIRAFNLINNSTDLKLHSFFLFKEKNKNRENKNKIKEKDFFIL